MKRLASPAALAAGFALLLIANVTIVTLAGWNRWGGPRERMSLTERELALPEFREEENSGLSLSLLLGDRAPRAVNRAAWRRRYRLPGAEHPWLDRAKLREIGWRDDLDPSDPEAEEAWSREGSRSVFLVLEMEGEAWRRWLTGRQEAVEELRRRVDSGGADRSELQDAQTLLALDRAMRSRLFPVDAGTKPEELRRRHPDPDRFFIVRGILSPRFLHPEGAPPRLDALIDVLPDRIHVPADLRPRFGGFLPKETLDESLMREAKEPGAWPGPVPPRYRIDLVLGHRLEPWIVRVTPVPSASR
jgi:Domain of unknown function (DUF4824)